MGPSLHRHRILDHTLKAHMPVSGHDGDGVLFTLSTCMVPPTPTAAGFHKQMMKVCSAGAFVVTHPRGVQIIFD